MKKFTFLIIGLFFFAQANSQVGVRVGYNINDMKFGGEEGAVFSSVTETFPGFHAGLFYNVSLSGALSVRPAALYSVKGIKADFFGDTFTTTFNYLEIPIDFVYRVYSGSSFGIDVHAGPYLAYMLSATNQEGEDDPEDVDFEEDGIGRPDFGLNLGVSADISNIIIGVNYGLGFSNVVDDPDQGDLSVNNRAIQIFAGYKFGGGSSTMDK